MNKTWFARTLLVILCAAIAARAAETVPTTVVSFNIRYGTATDGPDSWEHRRYLVRVAVRELEPFIFGVQECLWDQGVELNGAFAGYRITGVGRDDGVRKGEMCLIFTRNDRYLVLDQGFFWLSETPETPGSKGWDAACPRIVTWVKLRDRWCDPDAFYCFNTHLDHMGEEARRRGAELLQRRMAEIAGGLPILLMGDFNAPATSDSPPYRILAEEGWRADVPLRDTFGAAASEERRRGEGTFHGFTGEPSRGRIDWILASRAFNVIDAGISRYQLDGRYPSDHFPVWATFLQERHPPLPGDEVDVSTGATPRY
jgi:endonuclease/exonuclease/phosphatase family metal-dependent hydrolase